MIPDDWTTPEDLAPRMQRPVRWVKEQMARYVATGGRQGLPSVKVGGVRYWTPGCMAELERRHLAGAAQQATEDNPWGRAGRRAS